MFTDSGLLTGIGLMAGLALLVPWLVGAAILGVLIVLTNRRA